MKRQWLDKSSGYLFWWSHVGLFLFCHGNKPTCNCQKYPNDATHTQGNTKRYVHTKRWWKITTNSGAWAEVWNPAFHHRESLGLNVSLWLSYSFFAQLFHFVCTKQVKHYECVPRKDNLKVCNVILIFQRLLCLASLCDKRFSTSPLAVWDSYEYSRRDRSRIYKFPVYPHLYSAFIPQNVSLLRQHREEV